MAASVLDEMMAESEAEESTSDRKCGDSLPPGVVEAVMRHVETSVNHLEDTPFVKFKNGTLCVTDLTSSRHFEFKVSYHVGTS